MIWRHHVQPVFKTSVLAFRIRSCAGLHQAWIAPFHNTAMKTGSFPA
jgi:hypothetical protein